MYKLIACGLISGLTGPVMQLILRFLAVILSFFHTLRVLKERELSSGISLFINEISNLISEFLQLCDKVKK
jgi:hypothetical protein